MKKTTLALTLAAIAFAPSLKAAVSVGHPENAAIGFFFDSAGVALTAGGVSIGYFPPASAPLDSAFGTTITSWTTLLSAGYIDVRTVTGAQLSSPFNWNYPGTFGGTVINIPITSLPANTQLYEIAFGVGSYNIATPALSFAGSSQVSWAVVKDNANFSPADLGSKNILLNTAIGPTEVLVGTDNGVNVNLSSVPEPTSVALGLLGGFGFLGRRRRQRH